MPFFLLKDGEKIVISLRRHWLVLTFVLLRPIPFFVLPFIIWIVAAGWFDVTNELFSKIFWLASSLWWLFLWAGMAILWVNYYLDYWVITNQRVISTYQTGLFRREVSELSFSRIQDLTVSVKGIIKTFINYGNLEIRTAGTFEPGQQPDDSNVNTFVFKDIPRPYEVQNLLSKIHRDFVKASSQHV